MLPTLRLSEPAPDSVGLPNKESEVETLALDRAHRTDRLGLQFTPLALFLALDRGWWEEEVGVVASAQCCALP